ncbi:SRPBCC family protein [Algicella marina]|uniref:Polyketide cyclase n=1 Tax=Algicella marina TaxID=2683284 RepID=A0A6P1T2Q4_9RHOB|nr:SRPBCC family protein [Algicella marina]QHQ35589.1 hypothetical protein GO499_10555 [Algicella marina]
MRRIKRVILAVSVIAAGLILFAYALPRVVSASRSITIAASPAEIYPYLDSLQAFHEWSPWTERDPDMVVKFSGPDQGVGNRMEWVSDQDDVGTGSQEIIAAVPDERVETALDFGPMGTADAAWLLRPVDTGTEVEWTFSTDLGLNPVWRYMGLMMEGWVGADYEKGLQSLKSRVEGS